jgi:methylmalonyl-CoA mutase
VTRLLVRDNVARYQQMRNHVASPASAALVGAASAASPSSNNRGLAYLQKTARDRQNVFAALMEAVKTHSLGQISHALYDVGGEYRRNM